jgi:hypothetical protein
MNHLSAHVGRFWVEKVVDFGLESWKFWFWACGEPQALVASASKEVEMKLPEQIRDTIILSLDEYLETVNDQPDAAELAEQTVEAISSGAEDVGLEDSDEIVLKIEEEMDLEESLVETLEFEFQKADDLELSGEDLIGLIDRVCGLVWDDEDDFEDIEALEDEI